MIMNISYLTDNQVEINSRNRIILLGPEVKLGNYVIPGAGEYDVAGIQCEAHHFPQAVAYFIHSEDLTITFLSSINQEVIKLDDASATNILVVNIGSDDKPSDLKSILKSLEPSYLFLIGEGATPEFVKELDLPSHDRPILKLTHSGLPAEGTFLVVKK